ncbi:Hypothetical protein, putative, partial [Bodo saltans]
CIENFSTPPTAESSEVKRGGHILFAGPDHKGNLLQRSVSATGASLHGKKPITMLTLDDQPTALSVTTTVGKQQQQHSAPADFVASLSCVLYAMRPSGQWEYLPQGHASSTDPALLHKSRTDFNDRISPVSEYDVSLTREEVVAWAHKKNEDSKARRMEERRRTDYSSWMKAEEDRIAEMRT